MIQRFAIARADHRYLLHAEAVLVTHQALLSKGDEVATPLSSVFARKLRGAACSDSSVAGRRAVTRAQIIDTAFLTRFSGSRGLS
jgi:hypothetical protein